MSIITYLKVPSNSASLIKVGEDLLYRCKSCGYADNSEVHPKGSIPAVCPTCEKDSIFSSNAIELAHTFYLGDTYTSIFKTKFLTPHEKMTMSLMGCYGIGLSRMIAAIAQVSHDGLGILWPDSVAPWKCIVLQGRSSTDGEPLYDRIASVLGADNVLLDDRQSLGQRDKQSEAQRTGYPYIAMLTPKSETKDQITVIDRLSGSAKVVSSSEISDINFWARGKVAKA